MSFIHQNFDLVIASWFLTAVLCFSLRPFSFNASLVDTPDERKTHAFSTPLIGGFCVFVASSLTLLFFRGILTNETASMLVAMGCMLMLGLIDDRVDLSATIKFFGQAVISAAFVVSSNCIVTALGTPLGFVAPIELGILSIPFTLLAIIGLTNAFNMVDGCDGLASSLVLVSLVSLLVVGNSALNNSILVLLLTVSSALTLFLFFNLSNDQNLKTFLGDGGSLSLGFLVSVSLIKFTQSASNYDPSIALWFVAVPVLDFCAVIIRRLVLRRKITAADRSHLHHFLASIGFSHFLITSVLCLTALTLLFLGIFITSQYPKSSVWLFVFVFLLYLFVRFRINQQGG